MFECFESVLKISREDLVDLERCFLEKIDYNVIIQNYDYQYILSKFVEMEKFSQKENKTNQVQKWKKHFLFVRENYTYFSLLIT